MAKSTAAAKKAPEKASKEQKSVFVSQQPNNALLARALERSLGKLKILQGEMFKEENKEEKKPEP